jgi:hypothetical protein
VDVSGFGCEVRGNVVVVATPVRSAVGQGHGILDGCSNNVRVAKLTDPSRSNSPAQGVLVVHLSEASSLVGPALSLFVGFVGI